MSDSQLERIRAQFTRQAEAYAELAQTRERKGHAALVRLSGVQAGQSVLDVACGPGFLTMAFAEAGANAVGIDATPALLDKARSEARQRGLQAIRFELGDATHLPYPDASFDVVSCRAAFHHFPKPQAVLAEMARVAKPGGKVVVADMTTDEDPAKAAYHDRIERLCDPTHARALPLAEFEAMFAACGLADVACFKGRTEYEVVEWLSHGGPSDEATREILDLFEASLEVDRCGLQVRRDGDALFFSHGTVALIGMRMRTQDNSREEPISRDERSR